MPSTKSSPHSLVPSSLEDSSLDILLQPNITIELLIPLQLGSKLFTKFISQICLPTMSCWSSFGHVDTLGRLNLHHWTSNSHVSVLEQSIAIEGPCRTRSGCLQQPLKSLSWLSGRKKWPCHPLLSGSCKLYKHSLFSPDFAGCQLVFYNNWKIMSNTSSLHLDWHKILMGVQLNYHYAMGIPTTKGDVEESWTKAKVITSGIVSWNTVFASSSYCRRSSWMTIYPSTSTRKAHHSNNQSS